MKKKRNENVWRSKIVLHLFDRLLKHDGHGLPCPFLLKCCFHNNMKVVPYVPIKTQTYHQFSVFLIMMNLGFCLFCVHGFLIRNNHISIVLFVVRFKERNNKKESLMGSSSSSRLRHFTACVPVAFLVKRWSMDHNQCFLSLPIHWFVIGVQSGLIVCFCLCVFFLVFSTPISLINPCLLQRIVNTSLFRSTWLDSWFIINSSG